MKRDLGLIRDLMLLIERLDIPANSYGGFYLGDGRLQVEGCNDQEIAHHLVWLIEGGFLRGDVDQDGSFALGGLTWAGCEFLDDVRDPEIWRKTKEHVKSVAGVGLGFMWELAKTELRTKLGLP